MEKEKKAVKVGGEWRRGRLRGREVGMLPRVDRSFQ